MCYAILPSPVFCLLFCSSFQQLILRADTGPVQPPFLCVLQGKGKSVSVKWSTALPACTYRYRAVISEEWMTMLHNATMCSVAPSYCYLFSHFVQESLHFELCKRGEHELELTSVSVRCDCFHSHFPNQGEILVRFDKEMIRVIS